MKENIGIIWHGHEEKLQNVAKKREKISEKLYTEVLWTNLKY